MHTTARPTSRALARTAAALAVAALVAACGGGDAEPPPDTVPPTVAITDDVSAAVAGGVVTFTFTFSEDVGSSFVAEDVLVTGGTAGALTKVSDTVYTLAVTPPADATGSITVTVAAAKFRDLSNNDNVAEATASQAFDTQVAPPPTGTVLADFDAVSPPVAGFEGAEGSVVEPGPAGGDGNAFKVLRSGGQTFALGIIETTVPVTDTRRTISARVFSPTAGIPMVLKIEGPDGANSGDVQADQTVTQGWQTLTWTFTSTDVSKTYNKIVLLPNLGTVDAAPGKAYYFDDIVLLDGAPPPPPTGTVIANFDDVSPPVAGFEGAEGSAVEPAPVGGGEGNAFKVLRSGGQTFALGIIETTVPVTADRRTLSAQVFSPTAGVPMVLKLEGPDGANSGDTPANETVVEGWQTLTWSFPGLDVSKTYNKIVLLPNLGTIDAPPGKAYWFDSIVLLPATGDGGNTGPLTFSSGFGTGNRTLEGGEFGGFSGSNLDNFNCNGDPVNCGGGGEFSPPLAAAESYFFYYYQTPTPAAGLYTGIYVQAPGLVGGFQAGQDAAGVQVGSRTQLKFRLGQNEEWFNSGTSNFMIVMDLGKRYVVGGNDCRLQLRRVVTPTSAAAADYSIPLDSFALVQDCAGAVTSVSGALAASPISQIAFQGVGGSIALSDGTRTSGANLSVPNGDGRYPTTLVVVGGITIE